MKIAIIGAGTIGATHAARLSTIDEVEEILVSARRPEQAAPILAATQKTRAVSLERVLDERPDGVVITVSTASHAEWLHRCLDARIPAFTEKPIALDVATTREVIAHAAERPDTPIQVGFQRRFDRGYRAAREAYRRGSLGFVHALHATTYDEEPPPAAYVPHSGGLFKDCSIHDFDIIGWVTGRTALSVHSYGSTMGAEYFPEAGDVDSGCTLVRYDDGMVASIAASRYNGAGHDVRLELHGSNGQLFVGLDDRAPLRSAQPMDTLSWGQKEPWRAYFDRFADAFQAELSAFVDLAAGRISSPCTPMEALEALRIAEAATISARERRTVDLTEIG